MVNGDWELKIAESSARLARYLPTKSEFEEMIRALIADAGSRAAALRFHLGSTKPFPSWDFGGSLDGSPETNSERLADNRESLLRVDLWQGNNVQGFRSDTLSRSLVAFFDSFWKSSLRTPSAGSFDLKRDQRVRELAEATVGYSFEQYGSCALLFCDLDNFGKVNKEISQTEGDRVISEFGALLERTVSECGILLHDGGDEFIVLLPGFTSHDVLSIAFEIHRSVDAHDFRSGTIPLSVSIGVATAVGERGHATFADLQEIGNRGLHLAKEAGKATARFGTEIPTTVPSDTESVHVQRSLALGLCAIKSSLRSSEPFGNAWVDAISGNVRKSLREYPRDIRRAADAVRAFLEWARLDQVPGVFHWPFQARPYAHAATASATAIGLAVAHGILSTGPETAVAAPERLLLQYTGDDTRAAVGFPDQEALWRSSELAEFDHEFDLGSFWTFGSVPEECSTARAILVQIGHSPPAVPLTLFSERIVVDDRPTRGGGLPDFWEVTIARIVTHVCENPNVGVLYVFGEFAHATRTIAKLEEMAEWKDNAELIGSRIALPAQAIRRAADTLARRVQLIDNIDHLIDDLADLLRPAHQVLPISRVTPAHKRFLHRDLKIGVFGLRPEDGCRVQSIAEAFPIMLEIVRQLDSSTTIRDQAGQEILELIDFKVHLTQPTVDLVPEFYAGDSQSLETYFTENFLSPVGLFSVELLKHNQLEAVLRHVVEVLEDPAAQFATRRAILVIPHETDLTRDLAPLGLVSVRLILRFVRSRVRIHYSFTWRTVEALVGFPYSLYGSVRFGQHLTSLIQERLESSRAKMVEMDEVSYVAHSLHMFVDEHGQRIARRIIEDASL